MLVGCLIGKEGEGTRPVRAVRALVRRFGVSRAGRRRLLRHDRRPGRDARDAPRRATASALGPGAAPGHHPEHAQPKPGPSGSRKPTWWPWRGHSRLKNDARASRVVSPLTAAGRSEGGRAEAAGGGLRAGRAAVGCPRPCRGSWLLDSLHDLLGGRAERHRGLLSGGFRSLDGGLPAGNDLQSETRELFLRARVWGGRGGYGEHGC